MERLDSYSVPDTSEEVTTVDAEFDDDLFKELGFDLETRESVLTELETMYGGRIFHYGQYSGTVADMAASCPAFGDVLEQGVASAAAWLEANDQPEETLEEEETELLVEEPVQDKPAQDDQAQVRAQENESPKMESMDREISPAYAEEAASREALKAPSAEVVPTDSDAMHTSRRDVVYTQIIPEIIREPELSIVSPDTQRTSGQDALEDPASELGLGAEIEITRSDLRRDTPLPTSLEPDRMQEDELHKDGTYSEATVIPSFEALPQIELDEELIVQATMSQDAMEIFHIPPIVAVDNYHRVETELVTSVEVVTEPEVNYWYEDEILTEVSEESMLTVDEEESTVAEAPDDTPSEADEAIVVDSDHDESVPATEQDETVSRIDRILATELQEDSNETFDTVPEIVAIISELTEQEPRLLPEVELTELYRQADTTVHAIETLEKARTAEECREALQALQTELATLLQQLGYANAEAIAERLTKQYDVATLKKYISRVMRTVLLARIKDEKPKTLQAKLHVSYHLYGALAVRMVVNFAAVTAILPARIRYNGN